MPLGVPEVLRRRRDMVEVLTWSCARLYGGRSARNRAVKALGCAQRDIGPAEVVGGVGQDEARGYAASQDW
jgi:putative resolvase